MKSRVATFGLRTWRWPRIYATCGPRALSRSFSISTPRKSNTLMETSGFTDTQLQVRDAIAKICSNFPEVMFPICRLLIPSNSVYSRNTGLSTTILANILMNFTLLWPKMAGLELLSRKSLVVQD